MTETKRLVKSSSDRMVSGVCAGLADYFGIDPVLVRLMFVGLAAVNGTGVLAYIVLAVLMPEESPVSRGDTASANGAKKQDKTEFEPLGSRE